MEASNKMNKAKTAGRPEATYVSQVLAAIRSGGSQGMTPEQIREALPGLGKSRCKNAMERLVDLGRVYRLGGYRELLMFDASIERDLAIERHAQLVDELDAHRKRAVIEASRRKRAKRAAMGQTAEPRPTKARAAEPRVFCNSRWPQVLEYIRANPGLAYRQIGDATGVSKTAAAAIVGTLRQFGLAFVHIIGPVARVYASDIAPDRKAEILATPRAVKTKKVAKVAIQRATASINKLADKYRGTAAPKAPERPVRVTGMETARVTVAPAPRGRFEVDPSSALTGLSKLPLGVYAEPASRWASSATDRRAA